MSLTAEGGRIVSADIEIADSFLSKLLGLMFRKSFAGALIFDMGRVTYDGIHMLFVRFPIDVVFLDPDRRIVDLKENVRPWVGTAFPKSRFMYAIELPAGTIAKVDLKAGEKLEW
ncbi:MAG TPA: DUF192 domain-containing protein [Methanocella sp.]|uniref:DUF192 domain-containing protein n=1 Tax=Methanocella sp. TaxID=2052833 RepID=UPI002C602A34|nr:DUF192 domain-containing protein [Methanocella sp.]HTY91823.1 DUF192 domain-containing protein [Methanocella sp.]